MSTFVFDCPSCLAKNSTFNVKSYNSSLKNEYKIWQLFSICRACTSAIIITADVQQNVHYDIQRQSHSHSQKHLYIFHKLSDYINADDSHLNLYFHRFRYSPILKTHLAPPELLPKNIEDIFVEASKCLSIGCFNASAAMFRLCLDVVTKDIIEENESLQPTKENKKTIHNRLSWIFEKNILHKNLEELSRCIKDDGNDGAHDGNIGKEEADDLFDFTYELLEQVYTQPERIRLAQARRLERRK
ncbi:DUF4145 domain-containing protein [Acinetobacter baumannii]|uniref:DUF4145 domain-containing protein n=1 Tax=Acinetobacter baumannii TaxID=470 RepID=UPI00338FCDB4